MRYCFSGNNQKSVRTKNLFRIMIILFWVKFIYFIRRTISNNCYYYFMFFREFRRLGFYFYLYLGRNSRVISAEACAKRYKRHISVWKSLALSLSSLYIYIFAINGKDALAASQNRPIEGKRPPTRWHGLSVNPSRVN